MSNIGELIKEYRREKGLSQLDLSLKIGWENPSTLSRIEKNEVKPNRETILKLADSLDLNLNELNILLRSLNYVEQLPDINSTYITKLIDSIKEEWDKNKFPILLIDIPLNLLYWNKSAEKFFVGHLNNKLNIIKKYENKTYVKILFDDEYGIRQNVANWDDFAKILVRNIYSWNILQGEDRGFGEVLKECLGIDEFRKLWDLVKDEKEISPINYNIPFIYDHPIIGRISLYFTTFILRDDNRFFVEQMTPITKEDTDKLEKYLE